MKAVIKSRLRRKVVSELRRVVQRSEHALSRLRSREANARIVEPPPQEDVVFFTTARAHALAVLNIAGEVRRAS